MSGEGVLPYVYICVAWGLAASMPRDVSRGQGKRRHQILQAGKISCCIKDHLYSPNKLQTHLGFKLLEIL